jgi:glutaredoxin
MVMRFFIRLFFKGLRFVMGPAVLLWEIATRPNGLIRSPALQAGADLQCRNLVLYQYRTCPFCIKVRQEMRRLSLKIERRNAQQDGKNREDLTRDGGQAKVPCLKITDQAGTSQWLYDSGEIMAYLRGRFAPT